MVLTTLNIGATEVVTGLGTALMGYVGFFVMGYWQRYRTVAKLGSDLPRVPAKFPFGSASYLVEGGPVDGIPRCLGFAEDGIVFVQLGTLPYAIISRHEHMKDAWISLSPHHFPQDGTYKDPEATDPMGFWLGREAVTFLDAHRHEKWKLVRRLISKPFLSVNLSKIQSLMNPVHERFCDHLEKEVSQCAGGELVYTIEDFLQGITMDILGETMFSQDFKGLKSLMGGKKHIIVDAFAKLTQENKNRLPEALIIRPWLLPKYAWVPIKANREFVKNRNTINNETMRTINERRKLVANTGVKPQDFLQMLLDAEDDETSASLDMETLTANLKSILLAGYDTTSINLMYMLYEIARNPKVQERLQEEVDRVLSTGQRPGTNTHRELHYCHLVMKEALRLHSPIMFTIRAAHEDVEIGGRCIKKGTTVIMPLWHSMRDPHNWKNPLEFIPERHLPDGEAAEKFHANMPFAHGLRTCIGMRFAELSVILTVAALVQRFEFSVPSDYKLQVVCDFPMQRPKDPIRLIVRNRTRVQQQA